MHIDLIRGNALSIRFIVLVLLGAGDVLSGCGDSLPIDRVYKDSD
jgi:hypothetical protein